MRPRTASHCAVAKMRPCCRGASRYQLALFSCREPISWGTFPGGEYDVAWLGRLSRPGPRLKRLKSPIWRMRNARRSAAASDATRVHKHGGIRRTQSRWKKPLRLYRRARGCTRRFERPILRICNARQSEAASRSARVSKHEVDACGHGGRIYRASLGGHGGSYRLFEGLFCEYAMRGSPRPQPALLVSPSTKWTHAVTAEMPIVGISEGPGVNIAYSRAQFCEYAM
jgi:hypothetical protein